MGRRADVAGRTNMLKEVASGKGIDNGGCRPSEGFERGQDMAFCSQKWEPARSRAILRGERGKQESLLLDEVIALSCATDRSNDSLLGLGKIANSFASLRPWARNAKFCSILELISRTITIRFSSRELDRP